MDKVLTRSACCWCWVSERIQWIIATGRRRVVAHGEVGGVDLVKSTHFAGRGSAQLSDGAEKGAPVAGA